MLSCTLFGDAAILFRPHLELGRATISLGRHDENQAKLAASRSLTINGNPMARVRCITEMGMGVDVHGKDATKAARRAVSDAIRHSSLGFFRMVGKTSADMFVDVTIGVPDPGAVDTAAVAKELPYGTVTVTAVKGGLEIPAESGADAIIIANAAVIVSLDDGATG
jgi:uncharacterized protein (TIGR02058 family)